MTQSSFVAALRAGGLLLLTLLFAGSGCSSDECDGVEINGVCQATCDDSKCQPGHHCVRNQCSAPCTDQDDCAVGRNCVLWADPDGTQGQWCVIGDFVGTGQSEPCSADTQCDALRGYSCISGNCRFGGCTTSEDCPAGTCVEDGTALDASTTNYCDPNKAFVKEGDSCSAVGDCSPLDGLACVGNVCRYAGCRNHGDCIGAGYCTKGQDVAGGTLNYCDPSVGVPARGGIGTPCPKGDECDMDLVCVGAGEGDLDAYCTKRDCQSDDECGVGMFCSTVRSAVPCNDVCGFGGSNETGCIADSEIGPGKPYTCGPLSLLRNLCRKRRYCSECESDLDCMGENNQVCAKDEWGNKICTEACDPAVPTGCPWGGASKCGIFDTDKGYATCSHRFSGGCKASTGKPCEPCIDDADCPNGLCLASSFTGERFCLSFDVPKCGCTGGTTNGSCFDSTCKPGTCTTLNKNCGVIGDGCGGQIDCGTCSGTDTCGGGGIPNICGSGTTCTPKTCQDLAIECGPAGDGCGGVLDCGTCAAGTVCGEGGYGKCGATCPTSPGGLKMQCLAGTEYKDSPLFRTCYGANAAPFGSSSQQTGCWPN